MVVNFLLNFILNTTNKDTQGEKMARLFFFLIENFGRKKTLGFLKNVSSDLLVILR